MRVLYLFNPSRAHKILPLLEGIDVVPMEGMKDILLLRRTQERDDLILVDTFGRFGVVGVLASIFLRAPLVFRLRGDFFREQPERAAMSVSKLRKLYYWINVLVARVCLWRAELIICNSDYLASTIAPYLGRKQVSVVPNPYTEPEPEHDGKKNRMLPEAGLRILTVSRMNLYSKIQPIYEAIEDWIPPHLWEEWDIQWVICGGGHHELRLQELVKSKGLQERVHIFGQVEGMREMYDWSHVLVHLTRMESLGNAVMEAMAVGKPVITNVDSCGVRELVFEGENGFVVGDAVAFQAALHSYATDTALRDQHGRSGRLFISSQFSVPVLQNRMQEVLRGKKWSHGEQ